MYRQFATPNGTRVVIGYGEITWMRLNSTCFGRNATRPFAGKFVHWRTLSDVLADKTFMGLFLQEIQTAIGEIIGQHHCRYLTVHCLQHIGWSSTVPIGSVSSEDLEPFQLGERATCLRVKKSAKRLAPLTNLVTFSCDFLRLADGWSVVIHSLYPGRSIGQLRGENGDDVDVTAREGVAILDWTNPGEPLPAPATQASDQPQPQPGG